MSELPSADQPLDTSLPQTQITSQDEDTKIDNFYSPQNNDFYSKFRYSDLDPKGQSIRLLRIYPLNSEDEGAPITCGLVDNISLLAKPEYTTISYCAGNPNNTERIIVNGLEFNAFSNLGHALRQARHFWRSKFSERELLLWADQVCINQSNPPERSHQVGFIGDIYASAKQVLVCLSTEHDDAGGIEWFRRFLDDVPPLDLWVQDCVNSMDKVFKIHWNNAELHRGWDAFINTVLTSSWWSRAWVRQEFLRSPQAYFLATFEYIHWNSFVDVIRRYNFDVIRIFGDPSPEFDGPSPKCSRSSCQVCRLGRNPIKYLKAGKRINGLLQAKVNMASQPGNFPDLLYNLDGAHYCEASDPRDLIYSFMGFSAHNYGLYPDYSHGIHIQDIFIQLACNAISHNRNLNILLKAGPRQRYGIIDPKIPSWVPDWRNAQIIQSRYSQEILLSNIANVFFSFLPDGRGRKDRILQVRGMFYETLRSRTVLYHTKFPLGPKQFLSPSVDKIETLGLAEEGDEIWILHGAREVLIFRRQEQYYKVVDEVVGGICMAHFYKAFEKVDMLAAF